MKKVILILSHIIIVVTISFAQNIPAERLVNWSKAGVSLPEWTHEINVLEEGIINDGVTDNSDILNDLMLQFDNQPTTFFFPEGDYLFTKTLDLTSNIKIKGASAEATIFQFNNVGEAHLIQAKGQISGEKIPVVATIQKGDNYLLIDNSTVLQEGDLVKISANDSSLVTSNWALGTVGQIVDIQYVNDGLIAFNQEFRKAYSIAETPVLNLIEPIRNIGIECIKIIRNDATTNQTSNIYFENATNCWVKGVESENCNFAHIDIRTSNKITIEGGYFHHGFDYGGGGKAYGVVLQSTASDCLIQNNVFEHLRHSTLLQSGANGNVLAYNYSTDPFWTGTMFPDNAAGDLVLHGNYPYANLFEGNIVQNIVVDASHGKNGPLNTFFRNRTELYGIFTDFLTPTDSLNIIGNTILTGEVNPLYTLNGEGHFAYGNYYDDEIVPENTENLVESSLFLTDIPTFFPENFPFILLDNLPSEVNFSIPAKNRFSTEIKTLCGEPAPYVISTVKNLVSNDFKIKCFPNPLIDNELNVVLETEMPNEIISVFVFNSLGQEIFDFKMKGKKESIDVSKLASGVYFFKGILRGETIFTERVMKVKN